MTRLFFHIFLLSLVPFIGNAQKVKWEQTTVNFGTVRDWNSPPATFTFQNTGKEKLMFLPQRHDREVLVRYPNRAIRPGETASITIQYYTGETGSFSRTVEVYSNASNKPEKLTVKGNIKSIYVDALTSCPSFQTTASAKKGEPNVIQVVDAKTDRPIPGAQVEVFDRGIRKAANGTNLEGVAVNWIEPRKYIAIAYKEGYEKAEEEISFSRRNRSHIIYLDRKEKPLLVDGGRLTVEEEPTPMEETKVEEVDLGITTNEVLEQENRQSLIDNRSSQIKPEEPSEDMAEFDLGISTNNQWEEPEEVSKEMDLGISVNEQIAEELEKSVVVEEEINLGITTNEVLEDEENRQSLIDNRSSQIEELVEAALADAEPTSVNQPPSTETPEPEFSSEKFKPNNVLLLIDVSGSMKDDDKMLKLKKAVRRMVMMLRGEDVLTMIAYNSSSWEVLAPTPVKNNAAIVALVDSLQPYGYTNGVKGMRSAYESLFNQLIPEGNNQLIIATDGKFNSSKFSEKDAIQLVKSNSDKGIVLSIIGFGEDREATKLMRKLAREGNGSFMQVNKGQDPTELLAEEIKNRSRKL